jgi:hypothetical protein
MEKNSVGKNFLEGIAWLFFTSGIINILGVLFQASGASVGVGIFNTIIGYFFIRERISHLIKRFK